MQSIGAYDIEAEKISKIAENNDTTEAEVIEALCEYIPQMLEDQGWK